MPLLSLQSPAQGHTDILQYLLENLENKNDVNALDHIHATPAHDAAEYGQMESMLLLLKNGADISIKDTVRKLAIVILTSHSRVPPFSQLHTVLMRKLAIVILASNSRLSLHLTSYSEVSL